MLVQKNDSLVAYVRRATATGNQTLYQSILQKDRQAQQKLQDPGKVLSDTEKWALHREILMIWNPKDPCAKRKEVGRATLNSKLAKYRRFYIVLQSILESNPPPDWQETTFSKEGQTTKMGIILSSENEENYVTDSRERDPAVVQQHLEVGISNRHPAGKLPIMDAIHLRIDNGFLLQHGSSTQDAIMID